MRLKKLKYVVRAARPSQWIKNLVIYTSIVFAGKLFDAHLFWETTIGFLLFCALSSTSYILNDVIDFPYDKHHPSKKHRPIASGKLTIPDSTFIFFVFFLLSLIASIIFSVSFFIIALFFLLLHVLYSLHFKKYPVLDVFAISFSFMMRAFAGQVISGYHIQAWLFLTIFFIALFIASVKRHAELVAHGAKTRLSLNFYKDHLLNFLTTTFATLTITTYSLYTFLERPPIIDTPLSDVFTTVLPNFEARKWFMVTIPLVVYGVARYAQLLYEKDQGEAPEKIISQDGPLIIAIGLWGLIVVSLIYIF